MISSVGPAMPVLNSAAAPLVILDSDNEEVSSPIVTRCKPPRKKLFNGDSSKIIPPAMSAESNVDYLRKNKPLTTANKRIDKFKDNMKQSSSCGSSSPLKMVGSSRPKD